MRFEAEVHGRTRSHDVVLTMQDDDYVIGLKVNTFDAKRCFLIDPCNAIEPKGVEFDRYDKNLRVTVSERRKLHRLWFYYVVQDTENPEWASRYCTEKQVVVIGMLAYRRFPHGGKIPLSWDDFLDEEPSRREFSNKLRQFKELSIERWMQEKKDDSEEMKRILAGKVRRIA